MKILGKTDKGGYITELNPAEYEALRELTFALGGHPGFFNDTISEVDLSTALRAIRAYGSYRRIAQDMAEVSANLLLRLDHPEDN